MKRLIMLFIVMAFGMNVIAQEGSKSAGTTLDKNNEPSSVVMKDDKVWLSKDGRTTLLEKQIILNGTVVRPDCTITLKNGKSMVLKDGDQVTADGEIRFAEMGKVPDENERYQD